MEYHWGIPAQVSHDGLPRWYSTTGASQFVTPGASIRINTVCTHTVGQLPVIRMLLPTHTLLARCLAGMKSSFTLPSSLLSWTTCPPASTYTWSLSLNRIKTFCILFASFNLGSKRYLILRVVAFLTHAYSVTLRRIILIYWLVPC